MLHSATGAYFSDTDCRIPVARPLLEEIEVKKKMFGAIALLALIAAPALAEAASRGIATANVNMRSGPSTAYPAVVVIPNGAPLTIHGCLSDTPWCDVSFSYGRGWVAGRYIQAMVRQNRVYVEPRYYRDLGVPIVTFEVGRYWDSYYRDRDFYRDRDRWRRPSGGYWNAPPPWAERDRPRYREEWRNDRRGPNDGRWEDRYGDWNQNDRMREQNERIRRNAERQQWQLDRDRERDRENWSRERDRQNFERERERRDSERRDWERQRENRQTENERNLQRQFNQLREDDNAGRRPQVAPQGQQFGCLVGSPGCPNP